MRSLVTTWPYFLFVLTLIFVLLRVTVCADSLTSEDEQRQKNDKDVTAVLHVTLLDTQTSREIKGVFAQNSLTVGASGLVVHVRDESNSSLGCSKPVNHIPPNTKWIALMQRGGCKFHDKIHNAAKLRGASAVVVYNNIGGPEVRIMKMEHKVQNVVALAVRKEDGEWMASRVDNGTQVMMNISKESSFQDNFNKTSVLFVSISFIVLMVVSLAWLIFYYVQRFRYVHAKERLSRRLAGAAKKAISKIPLRTLKSGDMETLPDAQQCAVCIENFTASEVVRELPCRHLFHKSCVDPWLLDQRSCPMCKMDILKAYGLTVPGVPAKTATDDPIEITSTQSPEDSVDPIRSIHMVHVESGVIFHHRQESLGSPSSSCRGEQLDVTRKRNPSSDSNASHLSIKSHASGSELESLIHVKNASLNCTVADQDSSVIATTHTEI